MRCSTCTDNARCERLGLCQEAAKQQLPGPEPALPAGDPVDNERELTGDDALRFARASGMEEASRGGLFYAGVGDLIRFARLVRAGWTRDRRQDAPTPRAVADEVRAMFERLSALRLQFPEGSEIRGAVNAASDRVGVLASKLYSQRVPGTTAPTDWTDDAACLSGLADRLEEESATQSDWGNDSAAAAWSCRAHEVRQIVSRMVRSNAGVEVPRG